MSEKNMLQAELSPSLKACCEALLDKKAADVVIIDVKGVSSITDHYVLATGESGPQLKAMASAAARCLKSSDQSTGVIDGDPQSGWVVMDAFEFVVHLFRPETRDFYGLETLWKDRPRLSYQSEPELVLSALPKRAKKKSIAADEGGSEKDAPKPRKRRVSAVEPKPGTSKKPSTKTGSSAKAKTSSRSLS